VRLEKDDGATIGQEGSTTALHLRHGLDSGQVAAKTFRGVDQVGFGQVALKCQRSCWETQDFAAGQFWIGIGHRGRGRGRTSEKAADGGEDGHEGTPD
jgi:hypothetical protein